jgi:transcriptional regulator GlxA family with amidase domain
VSVAAVPAPNWPLHLKDQQGRLRLLAGWMYAERDAYAAAANDAANAFVAAFLAEYARLAAHEENALVDTVRQYVRENLAAALTLDALAARVGLSKYHFLRRYKAITGRTPMADVRAMRANHARDLVLTTSLPLKRIAVMAGLSDGITLSRVCRRYLGFAPGQLRRQHSGRG